MQVKSAQEIVNAAVVGTGAAGKTSLTECFAHLAGLTSRIGTVADGTTMSDYNPDEIERQISINAAVVSFMYGGRKLNIIDTPGFPDFVGEVVAPLQVVENAVLVIPGDGAVDAQTLNVLEMVRERSLPCCVFVNKLDKENLDLEAALKGIEAATGLALTPVSVPAATGAGMKSMINFLSGDGAAKTGPWYEKFIENAVSNDETLMEQYLGGETLDPAAVAAAVRNGYAQGQLVPVFCGSATVNVGVRDLLDFIAANGKTAADNPSVNPGGSPVALIFKTTSEPGMGQMNYVKVYSGTLTPGLDLPNAGRSGAERVSQMAAMQGKKRIEMPSLVAGDIGVLIKLKESRTNDVLGEKTAAEKVQRIVFPEPLTDMAITAKSKGEEEKLGNALSHIGIEEPTIRFQYRPETRQMVVSGIGTQQLDIIVKRIKARYHLEVELHKPRIPYKETIRKPAQGEMKYKKQSGGRGQYGHCVIKIAPLERGKGFEFVDEIFGGAIPKNYIPSVEKGVVEKMADGVIAGYPMVDLKVTLIDGSYHDVDSSDMSFKIAGRMALQKAVADASPVILEPIMNVEIQVPDEYLGGVMGDINSRRGRIMSLDKAGGRQQVKAQIPLGEMHAYAMDLRSITKGAGRFTMKLSHYEELPAHLMQPLIDEYQKSKTQAEE
jgi:elongation factor G